MASDAALPCAGAADPDRVRPRPSQQQIGLPKLFATRWVSRAIAILLAALPFLIVCSGWWPPHLGAVLQYVYRG